MPYSGGGGGTVLGSVSTVTGTAAAGQVVDATSASAAAWAYPPGYEFGYDQITATVNVTGTAEAAATTIITCAAHTFDGGAVMAQFYGAIKPDSSAAGDFIAVALFESTTIISRFAIVQNNVTGAVIIVSTTGQLRFTPTAASHTYTVQAWTSVNASASIVAGAGGTAANAPAFVRFVKV